ncbi:phosphotransferase family protein [Microlunatus parietis]|uniref:Ser/Thr protein kinase RdoA (MazF antagonist) n=1 Tax=Microlunatus parietis TaxID=682979 RepID=A0A7Y9ICX5_9ACTN|nr:aminoglycoside phosphotransferase family protein [Microlunatus parietis]NYE74301.1 Ser/Thr protein kinase RdoA (MazF antagonist) [Microlunatus parietis]
MAVDEASLVAALAGASPAITLRGRPRRLAGYANEIWFCDSDAGPVVAKVRLIPEEDPEQLATYVHTMDLLRRQGFPTPELLVFEESCAALDGRQFSVLRHADGAEASALLGRIPAAARVELLREFGRIIGRLHAIELPAGTVWRDDTGQAHPGWPEVFRAALDEVLAELTWLDGDERRLVDAATVRIEREAPALLAPVAAARLVHRDLHPGNFLVAEGRTTVLLDFEMVREWDAAYDFIKINSSLLGGPAEEVAAFHAGYREQVAPDDGFAARVRLYEGLYGLLSAAEFRSGNPRHRNWANSLRRWLAAEQDRL